MDFDLRMQPRVIDRGWKVEFVKPCASIRRTTVRNVIATLFAVASLTTIPSSAYAQDSGDPASPALTPSSAGVEAAVGSNRLLALVDEALSRSPVVLAARSHWQAQTKVPIQAATLPDPQISMQHFTVGSPQPFSGYESSDFYYTGFGVSQDIPGPGKLRLQKSEAEKDAEYCRRVARRMSRTAFSASSECVSAFDLISAPFAVKMSPKPSLPQSRHSVQLVLTGNNPVSDMFACKPRSAYVLDMTPVKSARDLINRGIARGRRRDQLEARQAFQNIAGERRSLPHHTHDVKWPQSGDDRICFREMVMENSDARPRLQL